SLLQANGGFLVLQANDILSIPYVWDRLKRTIKSQQLVIENLDEQLKVIPTTTLKPQPIPIDMKVIIIGSSEVYALLYQYDEDFRKYFKVRSHFDDEMERNEETECLYASFIATQCKRNNSEVNFDGEAISRIIEYGSRLIEDQNKLTTQFNLIADIVNESIYWATQNNRKTVTLSDVIKTLQEKRYRANLVEEKMQKMILDGSIRIDTAGKVIGQINGLSVLSNGEYAFGRPTRITATSSLGKGNLINIEKESGLSGPIFDKGVMILSAYINNIYANDRPFPVAVNLCFEQSYSGVEGDSASAAELVVMLSSIADVPIRQDLAITGSMDQQGNIQPIGGVNYKIEGFFDVCVKKGLTGTQGVIIPWQNKQNLMLRDDIVEAVSDGKFHIYTIKRAEEAIELLTDMTAAQFDKKVKAVLEKFIQITKEFHNKSN
ncbi:MAG: AAA family ATPase, partial [Caldisericia bacterium]|nr:AAA family ATPase [Caldisericia bacterium]